MGASQSSQPAAPAPAAAPAAAAAPAPGAPAAKTSGWNPFAKKNLGTEFTDNYGESICIVAFICSVFSRMAYMDDHQLLGHYEAIFGDDKIIPGKWMTQLNKSVVDNGLHSLLQDSILFKEEFASSETPFGLKKFKTSGVFGTESLQFLPWAQKINVVNGEQRIDANTSNCEYETKVTVPDDNLIFVAISTSNYETVYVMGDKRWPNCVWVVFTGTKDLKSAGSYSKLSSINSLWTNDIKGLIGEEEHERYLFGIYKILMEMIHTIMDAVKYVSSKTGATGNANVITTGHSLGGALATIFAATYVMHISNKPDFKKTYPNLNENIACFSLGAPRVLSNELARNFCLLTKNNETLFKDDATKQKMVSANNIKGFITFLRIVTRMDPIPALPPGKGLNYAHPCSANKGDSSADSDPEERKNVSADCLVEFDNSFSTRCAKNGKPSATLNFIKPLSCVNSKKARTDAGTKDKANLGPAMIKFPVGFHLMYLGISYAGGVSLAKIHGHNIGRVREAEGKGNTVLGVFIYPSLNTGNTMASIGFIDLKKKESTGSLMITDAALEQESSNLGLSEPTVAELSPSSSSRTVQTGGADVTTATSTVITPTTATPTTPTPTTATPTPTTATPTPTTATPTTATPTTATPITATPITATPTPTTATPVTSSPNSMLSDLTRTFSSKKNTVPEDVYISYNVFEKILSQMVDFDIIGKKDVPQDYTTLIQVNNETPDTSFETDGSSSTPIITTGGKKYKRSKTKRGRKTRKHRKNKSRRNKKRKL
jgi:hypothetical protein